MLIEFKINKTLFFLKNLPNNMEKGFYYTVTKEQVLQHQKRSIVQILQWLYETNLLLSKIQTQEEKDRVKTFKIKR